MTKTVLRTHNQNGNVRRMDLSNYAISKGGTAKPGCPVLEQVAQAVGCSPATLYMISKGHKQASAALVNRISSATRGAVERSTLRPDVFDQPELDPDAGRIVPVESA